MNKDSFIYQVAEDLLKAYNNDISNLNIIFPNKRIISFFNEALYDITQKPFLSPNYLTISDFIEEETSITIADELSLLYYLYRAYESVYKSKGHGVEDFSSFFLWGKIILSDFDDIDKNLGDVESLFSIIRDYKEIDDRFDFLDDEQKKLLNRFFEGFKSKEKLSEIKESFLQLWNQLLEIYKEFNKILLDKSIGYSGLVYRKIACSEEDIFEEGDYAVVGFNALNQAEKKIFESIKKAGNTRFYWDYDEFYLDDLKQEAGLFIRENLESFPMPESFKPKVDNITNKEQRIRIISSPSENAQTSLVKEFFESLENEEGLELKDIAIVLGNEALMPNLINNLPPIIANQKTKVNITMGYPYSSTAIYSLTSSLLYLHSQTHRSKNISFSRLLDFVENPYIQTYITDEDKEILGKLKETKASYIDLKTIEELSFSSIITPKQDIVEIIDSVIELTKYITKEEHKIDRNSIDGVFYEILFRVVQSMNLLKDIIEDIGRGGLDIELGIRIINSELDSISIPFEGDPIDGVQIMGLLESRNLDFKHILFLSANDDMIPRVSMDISFIPYSIRRAYMLNTIDKKIGIFAYYFYRLIQRTDNITYVYSSDNHKKEISRFLNQIIIELGQNPHKTFIYNLVESEIKPKKSLEIKVVKTAEDIEKIKNKSYLSASFLNDYLDCPMMFYLKRITELEPYTPYSDDITPLDFGNIFHESSREIYKDLNNKTIDKNDIEEIKTSDKRIKEIVTKVFFRDFLKQDYNPDKDIEQSHRVNIDVIIRYIQNLLEYDRHNTPFVLNSMEEKYETWLNNIKLGGIIDRIDQKDGDYSIIDYKTGRYIDKPQSIDEIFARFGDNDDKNPSRNNHQFQILFYSYLFYKNKPEQTIKPELRYIASLKSSTYKKELIYRVDKKKIALEDYKEIHHEFEENLKELIDEIVSGEGEEYRRRRSEDNCKYCDYKHYCM